jgi:hypothetical protein
MARHNGRSPPGWGGLRGIDQAGQLDRRETATHASNAQESGRLIPFPRAFRKPILLPPDAKPNHRARDVEIWPDGDGWLVEEWDEGGASLVRCATKREALTSAMYWLDDGDASLLVRNTPRREGRS